LNITVDESREPNGNKRAKGTQLSPSSCLQFFDLCFSININTNINLVFEEASSLCPIASFPFEDVVPEIRRAIASSEFLDELSLFMMALTCKSYFEMLNEVRPRSCILKFWGSIIGANGYVSCLLWFLRHWPYVQTSLLAEAAVLAALSSSREEFISPLTLEKENEIIVFGLHEYKMRILDTKVCFCLGEGANESIVSRISSRIELKWDRILEGAAKMGNIVFLRSNSSKCVERHLFGEHALLAAARDSQVGVIRFLRSENFISFDARESTSCFSIRGEVLLSLMTSTKSFIDLFEYLEEIQCNPTFNELVLVRSACSISSEAILFLEHKFPITPRILGADIDATIVLNDLLGKFDLYFVQLLLRSNPELLPLLSQRVRDTVWYLSINLSDEIVLQMLEFQAEYQAANLFPKSIDSSMQDCDRCHRAEFRGLFDFLKFNLNAGSFIEVEFISRCIPLLRTKDMPYFINFLSIYLDRWLDHLNARNSIESIIFSSFRRKGKDWEPVLRTLHQKHYIFMSAKILPNILRIMQQFHFSPPEMATAVRWLQAHGLTPISERTANECAGILDLDHLAIIFQVGIQIDSQVFVDLLSSPGIKVSNLMVDVFARVEILLSNLVSLSPLALEEFLNEFYHRLDQKPLPNEFLNLFRRHGLNIGISSKNDPYKVSLDI
jgi:hypothetical protein